MSYQEEKQERLNRYMYRAIKRALSEYPTGEYDTRDPREAKISYAEAMKALRHTISRLKDLQIKL